MMLTLVFRGTAIRIDSATSVEALDVVARGLIYCVAWGVTPKLAQQACGPGASLAGKSATSCCTLPRLSDRIDPLQQTSLSASYFISSVIVDSPG